MLIKVTGQLYVKYMLHHSIFHSILCGNHPNITSNILQTARDNLALPSSDFV